MSNIDISVIVPVFNRDNYIARCIRSLVNQSISKSNYEIIVVDDNSSDNTAKSSCHLEKNKIFEEY